jgi:hypothetical protein
METDADASGIHTWLFGFVRVILTTIQTHRFPTSLSRMGSPARAAKLGIGPVDTKSVIPVQEQYDPGLFPNAEPQTTQGLLLMKHALRRLALTQQVSMPWNRHHGTESHQNQKDQKLSEHFTWHCSVHPTGQQKEQCSAGFASGRSTISRYGVDCQSMHAFAPFAGAWLSAPVQQDDQKTGKGARAHPLL